MPSIDFYYMSESPPCRTIEMVASLAGVKLNKHPINLLKKEHLEDDYLKLNPLHKVPFIVDGDLKLGESRAIAAYLINKYMPDDNNLYPKEPVARAQIDELLYMDACLLVPAVHKLLGGRLRDPPILTIDADAEKDYRAILTVLENSLKNKEKQFLLGDHLTLADIVLIGSFAFPEANEYDISEFKLLIAYLDRVKKAIPNFKEINEVPQINMKNYMKTLISRALAK